MLCRRFTRDDSRPAVAKQVVTKNMCGGCSNIWQLEKGKHLGPTSYKQKRGLEDVKVLFMGMQFSVPGAVGVGGGV